MQAVARCEGNRRELTTLHGLHAAVDQVFAIGNKAHVEEIPGTDVADDQSELASMRIARARRRVGRLGDVQRSRACLQRHERHGHRGKQLEGASRFQ